jgi:soluble lytic murein transglycosylase-like protein
MWRRLQRRRTSQRTARVLFLARTRPRSTRGYGRGGLWSSARGARVFRAPGPIAAVSLGQPARHIHCSLQAGRLKTSRSSARRPIVEACHELERRARLLFPAGEARAARLRRPSRLSLRFQRAEPMQVVASRAASSLHGASRQKHRTTHDRAWLAAAGRWRVNPNAAAALARQEVGLSAQCSLSLRPVHPAPPWR